MVEAFLEKKYKLDSSENWDEFMKAVGVGLVTRKLAHTLTPVMVLTKEGDEYVLTTSTNLQTIVVKFKPGVEFDGKTPDGRKVKSTFTIDGNVLHEVQVGEDGKKTLVERTFSESQLTIVMTYDSKVTATRVYKIQA